VAMKRLMAGQMFSKVDADSSGLIDAGELQLMLVYLGLDLSESQCGMVMAEIDEDGSGEIDLEEFIIWFQRI
jgi:Ca2+-binding EF-hand superfamily protein